MKKTKKVILSIVIVFILLGGGVFVGMNWSHWFSNQTISNVDENAQDYKGNKETYTGKKNTDTIDIPGFDKLTFKAGTKKQKVNFYNPKQNTCYFRLSMCLQDGTKLWQSQLIKPGKAIYEITLNKGLKTGEYQNCLLKYECFQLNDEQTPLNGSQINFNLSVLE